MREQKDGRATDTRERILREASRLYLAGSYEAVSMQVLAERLDISKATIFHHFKNKQEMFFEMWLMNAQRFQTLLQEALASSELRSTQARLRSLMQALARTAGFGMPHMLQDLTTFLSPSQREEVQRHLQAGIMIIRQVLEEGIAREELRPHNTQFVAYTLLLLGRQMPLSVRSQAIPLDSLPPGAWIDALLDLLLDGLKSEQARRTQT